MDPIKQRFSYGPTGTTRMAMGAQNPFVRAQAEDNAFSFQKQHEQDMFERGMMQQEQARRSQETAQQGEKYRILGNLLR